MASKKIRYPRTIKSRVPPGKQEFLLSWSGKERDHFNVYTNYDSMAAFFLMLAQDNKIEYQLTSYGLFVKLPSKLLPFKIPIKRPLKISAEERERRREWCRKIGLANRKRENHWA